MDIKTIRLNEIMQRNERGNKRGKGGKELCNEKGENNIVF